LRTSVEDLILEWLALTSRSTVSSHEIQLDFIMWVKNQRNLQVNPATADRKFRLLREQVGGLETREIDTGSKETTWEILACGGIEWSQYV